MVRTKAVTDEREKALSFKAKTVRRTIGVMEYFATQKSKATVMDLVRGLGVPQSSMSELLSALVESGVLVRDASARLYSATPKMAALGLAAQPQGIADGSLFRFMDSLSTEHCLDIGLFGVCGLDAQLHRLSIRGDLTGCDPSKREIGASSIPLELGARVRLSTGVIGNVLLAALGSEQYERLLWRLLSEATPEHKFNFAQACGVVRTIEGVGAATGPSAFAKGWSAVAVRVPRDLGGQPLALAAFYRDGQQFDPTDILTVLQEGLRFMVGPDEVGPAAVQDTIIAA